VDNQQARYAALPFMAGNKLTIIMNGGAWSETSNQAETASWFGCVAHDRSFIVSTRHNAKPATTSDQAMQVRKIPVSIFRETPMPASIPATILRRQCLPQRNQAKPNSRSRVLQSPRQAIVPLAQAAARDGPPCLSRAATADYQRAAGSADDRKKSSHGAEAAQRVGCKL
jgi:hypothetical protein